MMPQINNTLVDFKMEYVQTNNITGLGKEKIITPIRKMRRKI